MPCFPLNTKNGRALEAGGRSGTGSPPGSQCPAPGLQPRGCGLLVVACTWSAWSPSPAGCLVFEPDTRGIDFLQMGRLGACCKGDTVTCTLAATEVVWLGCVTCRKTQDLAWALWQSSGVCSNWLCASVLSLGPAGTGPRSASQGQYSVVECSDQSR